MTAPSTYFKVAGDWKLFTDMHYKVAGTWKLVPRAYVKANGEWKLVHGSHYDTLVLNGGAEGLPNDTTMYFGLGGADGHFVYASDATQVALSTLDPVADVESHTGLSLKAFPAIMAFARSSDGYYVVMSGTSDRVAVITPAGAQTTSGTITMKSDPILASDGAVYFIGRLGAPTFSDFIYRVTNSVTPESVIELGNAVTAYSDIIAETNDSKLAVAFLNGDLKTVPLAGGSFSVVGTVDTDVTRLAIAGDDSVWTRDSSSNMARNGVLVDTGIYDLCRSWRSGRIVALPATTDSFVHYAADGTSFETVAANGANNVVFASSKYQRDDILMYDAAGQLFWIHHV